MTNRGQKNLVTMMLLSAVCALAPKSLFASDFGQIGGAQLFSSIETDQVVLHSGKNIKSKTKAAKTSAKPPARSDSVAALLSQPTQSFAELAASVGVKKLVADKVKSGAKAPLAVAAVPIIVAAKVIAPQAATTPASAIVVNVEKKQSNGKVEQQSAILKIEAVASAPVNTTQAILPPIAAVVTAATAEVSTLIVERREGKLAISPENIVLKKTGSKTKVVFKSDRSNDADFASGLSVFVRDVQTLEWNSKKRELTAKAPGRTELYIVSSEKMHIVPVSVTGASGSNWDLQVPDTLVSLDGLVQKQMATAIFPDQISSAASVPTSSASANEKPTLTIHESIVDVSQTNNRVRAEQGRFSHQAETLSYTKIALQIVDERTRVGAGVYPVAGARVRIIGTEFSGESNSTGHIIINDMPQRSRLMAVVDHPGGVTRSSVIEIRTGRGPDSGVQRIKVSRDFAFDSNSRVAGAVQNSGLASVCGIAMDTATAGRPVTGVKVALDIKSDGPYYFNRFGFLDRSLGETTDNGKFCFFNADAGITLASFYADGSLVATMPLTLHSGRHLEEDYALAQATNYGVQLATAATAHEQLSSDAKKARGYQMVDVVDLIPIGNDRPLTVVESGYVSTTDGIIPYRNRNLMLVRASEFEPAVYALDASRSSEPQVTPFLPRGFIEDMSVYAQIAIDPELGSVLVEHGDLTGQGNETVHVRLLNESSFDVGDGWYYSDSPLTKAIFFNVPPGTYSVLVETANRFWLAADTVTVFSETVSYVQSGALLRVK